jgi:hypothetical protein
MAAHRNKIRSNVTAVRSRHLKRKERVYGFRYATVMAEISC